MADVNVATALAVNKGNRLYKSNLSSVNMYTPGDAAKGIPCKRIIFVKGIFQTSDEDIIAYLDKECKNGHPDIRIDEDEKYFDPAKYDIREMLKREVRLEMEREAMLAAQNRNMGSSEQGKLNAASTSTIAATAAGGMSQIPVLQVPSAKK